MQSNNSNSSKLNTSNNRTKNIIMMFFPIIITIILQYTVIIGDIIIIFLKNLFSDHRDSRQISIGTIMSRDYKQPMNIAFMSLAQYIVFAIVFGIWFYKVFCQNETFKENISKMKNILTVKFLLALMAIGYAGQLMVDGILALVRPIFTDAFTQYDKMVSNIIGINSSWPMLLSIILMAPIAEELLFRGLIQGYGKRAFSPMLAILIQSLLFGLYHGNIIQGVYAFVMGFVLGLIAHKSSSIIPSIILHISINASLLFVPAKLFEATDTTIIATVLSGIIFVILLVVILRRKPSHQDQTYKQEA